MELSAPFEPSGVLVLLELPWGFVPAQTVVEERGGAVC